jgi:hypothetical protein
MFENERKELMLIVKESLAPFIETKMVALQEFEAILELLDSYTNIVPELLYVLKASSASTPT